MNIPGLSQRDDFRALIDTLPGVAIWIVGEDGEFEYVSTGFEDIWGIPADTFEDDPGRLIETIHPEDRGPVVSLLDTDPDEITAGSFEGRVVAADGTTRWVQTHQVPVRDDDGSFESLVGISMDVTTGKRREEELEALNQLVRHDIRNDMNVILGWTQMLEGHVDDEGADKLDRVLTTAEHVVELTEIARDYVESIAGEEEATVKPVPLAPVLEHQVQLRADSYPDARIEIVGEVPAVEVTANQMLSSVFQNLLNNAVQHSDREEPRVEVSCVDRGDDVVVRIADDGPGIPDQQKEAVFGKGKKRMDSPGTGIGLYLVRTLVDQYGGEVTVEDNDPRGTVFALRLSKAG